MRSPRKISVTRGTTVETPVMVAKSMQPQDIFYCDAVMVANMFGPDNELVVCVVSNYLFLSSLLAS